MELLKRHKLPHEDLKVNWSKEGGVSIVLEHFKIIGEGNLTKIGANQGL